MKKNGKSNLFGDDENNWLDGGNARDILIAYAGNDHLLGGNGKDELDGGDGDDILNGGRGKDILTGGAGNDTFVIERGSGKDIITDFNQNGDSNDTIILDFEEINTYSGGIYDNYSPIEENYGGLTWGNKTYVLDSDLQPYDSGYENGTISGTNVAFNGYNSPFVIEGEDFDFNAGYFTAAWNNGLEITITAYDDGEETGSYTTTINYDSPTYLEFDDTIFDSVDMIVITSSGGVDANPNDNGQGTQIAMDDLEIGFGGSNAESDVIDLSALGIEDNNDDGEINIDDLDISQDGDDTIINLMDGGSLTLLGVDHTTLNGDDFLF